MKFGMEKDVSVIKVFTRFLEFVEHAMQILFTMALTVNAIMDIMGIEIFVRNVMEHVENVQALMLVNARHALTLVIDLIMVFVQEIVHVHLGSTLKALNVKNVPITATNARICLLVIFVLQDL